MTSVLYLAGYGRSGTTILDIMLSSHPAIVSGGEVFRAAEIFADEGAMCTCGQPMVSCPVWGDVRPHYVEAAKWFGGLDALQTAFMGLEGQRGKNKDIQSVWADLNAMSLRALMASKADAKFVVDSSKTARGAALRPALLSEVSGLDVTVLPVQRRAGSVIASARKGTNRDIESGAAQSDSTIRGLKAYAGWIMAHSATTQATAALPSLSPVHHEELIVDAGKVFGRVLSELGLPDAPDWRDAMARETRHLIGGNRNRFETPKIRQTEGPVVQTDLLTRFGRGAGALLARSGVLR